MRRPAYSSLRCSHGCGWEVMDDDPEAEIALARHEHEHETGLIRARPEVAGALAMLAPESDDYRNREPDADGGRGEEFAEEFVRRARQDIFEERNLGTRAERAGRPATNGASPVPDRTPMSHDDIIEAIVRWAETHDGRPPTSGEWVNPPDGYPTSSRVKAEFGSWNRAIIAAGFEPRAGRRPKTETPAEPRRRPTPAPESSMLDLGRRVDEATERADRARAELREAEADLVEAIDILSERTTRLSGDLASLRGTITNGRGKR